MRGMAKKCISTVLLVASMFGYAIPTYAEEDTASVVYGSPIKTSNFDWIGHNSATVETIGGKEALHLGCDSDSKRFIMASVSDSWLYAPDGTSVEFEIEYYDTGTGSFVIAYDSTENNDVGSKDSDIVRMTDTGEWKTANVYIGDMRGTNAFETMDFRIGLWGETLGFSTGDVYIRSITIRKVFPKHPVDIKLSTPYFGNILGGDEDRKITVDFDDLTDERMNTTVTYKIIDENDKLVKQGTVEKNPDLKMQTSYIDLNDITRYGLYKLDVTAVSEIELDGETKEFTSDANCNFSIIRKHGYGETNPAAGVCTHIVYGKENDEEIPAIASWAGFGSVRDEMFWEYVETEKGKYTLPEWGQKYLDNLRKSGVKMLFIANGGNPFYYDYDGDFIRGTLPKSDNSIKGFADYCAWMTRELNDVLVGIEIWNEPNTQHSNYYQIDGAGYAKVIKAAYEAIKGVDKNMPVIGFGATGSDTTYAEQAYKGDSYKYSDALAAHPYNWDSDLFIVEDYYNKFDKTREMDAKYGVEQPYWFTEFGQTTSQGAAMFEATERVQAQTLIKEYVTGMAYNLFDRTYWYDLISDGLGKNNSEQNFGLVRYGRDVFNTPYSAKPAYVAAAGLNDFLANAEFIEVKKKDREYYAFRFRKNGEDIAVLWTNPGTEQSVGIDLGCDNVEIYDRYTNCDGTLSGINGVFSFGLGTDPIYLKGNFAKFELTDPIISQSEMKLDIMPSDMTEIALIDKSGKRFTVKTTEVDGFDISASDVQNCKGTVVIKSKADIKEQTNVGMDIYDGEKMVYHSFAELNYTEPLSMGMSLSNVEANNPYQKQVAVTIKNMSNTMAVAGTCKVVDVDGTIVSSNIVPFKNLKPQDSVTTFLNLDTATKERNSDVTVQIALDNGYVTDYTERVGELSVGYANNAPKIDGKLTFGEWNGRWVATDKSKSAKSIKGWGGADDVSFDANIMYDEEKLYLGINVTDNIHNQENAPAGTWAGDSFQFAIEDKIHNGDYMVAPGGKDINFTEFCAALTGGEAVLYRHTSQFNLKPAGLVENAEIAITRNGNKTVYEIAVPWTEIFGDECQLDTDKVFGFSMLVNDNDGNGRRGWIEYSEGIGEYKDALLFKQMRLVNK